MDRVILSCQIYRPWDLENRIGRQRDRVGWQLYPVSRFWDLFHGIDLFDQLRKDVDTKFDRLQKDIDARFDQVNLKFDRLQQDIVDLKVGQTRMETEINGIGKRLDTQEFINRSVVVGFVLALAAGAVKLFFPDLSTESHRFP